jgi:hypothetical protein
MREGQVLAESRQGEIREELARLVESPAFRSSKRCKEFLQYVVDQTVNGANGSLKERSIGIELFGLPSDYDTSQHTIVRVTASETRKKLAQFYQSEGGGTNGAVRIDLPPGSYSAEFTWNDAAPVVAEVPALQEEAPATAIATDPKEYSRRWLLGSGAAGGLAIAGLAAWGWQSSKARVASASSPTLPVGPVVTGSPAPTAGGAAPGAVRIGVGSSSAYLDRNGQSWGADRYFTGGQIMARPSERIGRTLDPDLYRRVRVGDFRYDIPLAPGVSYELHLHFAETGLSDFISAESSGEGQRVFRITANGKMLLDFFDVVADAAGTNIATERVFRNVSPAEDGFLHLAFSPLRGSAMVNAIEVLPVAGAGKGLPLRIRSGWPAAWQDSTGAVWRADSYFAGGNALVRRTNPARESAATIPDHTLYSSERWGHFSYALPAAATDGRYRVTLKFCEGHLGPRNTGVGGVGGRVFDVYCNGVVLLKDFDIVREAGGEGRPIDRTFRRVRPNAQGKILLTFVPTTGMACVNGIEVVDDGDF